MPKQYPHCSTQSKSYARGKIEESYAPHCCHLQLVPPFFYRGFFTFFIKYVFLIPLDLRVFSGQMFSDLESVVSLFFLTFLLSV